MGLYTSVGVFVCFEGGEGSGKSTQSRVLGVAGGRGVRRPADVRAGRHRGGCRVRQIVLDPATGELSDRTESLLYAADKAEHVHRVVQPALDRGEVVITDRYVDSMLAYQGAGRPLELAEVEHVARWATHDLRPHLTVVLDLEPDHGLGRFAERDRIEGESVEFHERVRQAYLDLAARDPDHYLVVDARLPVNVVAAAVQAAVQPPWPGQEVMTVWDDLVGQAHAVEVMKTAVTGQGMSHAWLFTGPPGSGRSNAALALAAALQCEQGGCGECHACHTIAAGTHADVTVVRTEKLSIGVDEVRDLVRRSALAPAGRRWQIMIVEDADRLTEHACNALLKAIEEPTERTVWMLCAPTVEDVLPTIRSRCRLLTLATPTAEDVAAFLVRQDGVADGLAAYAARASQATSVAPGRSPATRPPATAAARSSRSRRGDQPGCLQTAATNLAEVTKEEADLITTRLDEREKADLDAAYGVVERGRRPRSTRRAWPTSSAPRRRGPSVASSTSSRWPDGPRVGLPRRDRGGDRGDGAAGQRGDPRQRRRGRRGSAPSSTCGGSGGSSRPARRCWSSTSRCRWRSRASCSRSRSPRAAGEDGSSPGCWCWPWCSARSRRQWASSSAATAPPTPTIQCRPSRPRAPRRPRRRPTRPSSRSTARTSTGCRLRRRRRVADPQGFPRLRQPAGKTVGPTSSAGRPTTRTTR